MRQKDGGTFAELLCRIREANCSKADIALLQTRVVSEDDDNYPDVLNPKDVLVHVYKKMMTIIQKMYLYMYTRRTWML